MRTHGLDGGLFLGGVHQVEDLGRGSYAAHFAALEVLTVQHASEYFGQLLQCGGLNAAESSDTKNHVIAQFFLE